MAQRHVGRAVQRQRQRHRAAQIGGAEQRDQSDIGQHRRRGGERHGAERAQPAQHRETLEHDEYPGITRLERAAEAREHPGDQSVARGGPLAVERAGEQGEIGQDGGDQQVLALAEIAGRHHQQHGADRGEHRQPVLEQPAAARSSEAVHQAQASTAATKNGMAVNCASMPSTPASQIGMAEIQTISGGLISTTST